MVHLLFGAVSLFAAREWLRARGLDGSPRNGDRTRTGVRQGWERLWPAVCGVLNPPWPP